MEESLCKSINLHLREVVPHTYNPKQLSLDILEKEGKPPRNAT